MREIISYSPSPVFAKEGSGRNEKNRKSRKGKKLKRRGGRELRLRGGRDKKSGEKK